MAVGAGAGAGAGAGSVFYCTTTAIYHFVTPVLHMLVVLCWLFHYHKHSMSLCNVLSYLSAVPCAELCCVTVVLCNGCAMRRISSKREEGEGGGKHNKSCSDMQVSSQLPSLTRSYQSSSELI